MKVRHFKPDVVTPPIRENGNDDDALEIAIRAGAVGDDELADLICQDGRARRAQGQPVSLGRYLSMVPDLRERTVPLDAAISAALRGSVLDGASLKAAESQLIAQHPEIAQRIAESAMLEAAFGTSLSVVKVLLPESLQIPSDFGPMLHDGRPRYTLVKQLGRGSFCSVYLAEDRHLAAPGSPAPLVAIKVGHRRVGDSDAVHQLATEAARARVIDHPNVARVYERGITPDGFEYIVSEYAEGGSLRSMAMNGSQIEDGRCRRERIEQLARFAVGIAKGLEAIHGAGFVHRDLKPENVLLGRDGTPRIVDFGLAVAAGFEPHSRSETGSAVVGTLAFMAPERLRSDRGCNSVSADVFSLGALMFYLLVGRPVLGQSVAELQSRAWQPHESTRLSPYRQLLDAGVSATLAGIISQCVAFDASDRYLSAHAVADDLERWLADRPVSWMQGSFLPEARLWIRRNPLVACLLLIILVQLFVITALIQSRSNTASPSAEAPTSQRQQPSPDRPANGAEPGRPKTEAQPGGAP